jgi:hypothetical protein
MAQRDVAKSGVIDANGALTISLRPDSRRPWVVSQVASFAEGAGGSASAQIFKNGAPITALGVRNGTAGQQPFITLRPSDTMSVVYAGATVGAPVTVNFIYDDGV